MNCKCVEGEEGNLCGYHFQIMEKARNEMKEILKDEINKVCHEKAALKYELGELALRIVREGMK